MHAASISERVIAINLFFLYQRKPGRNQRGNPDRRKHDACSQPDQRAERDPAPLDEKVNPYAEVRQPWEAAEKENADGVCRVASGK